MSQQFNRVPTYQEVLADKGTTTRGWYTYWMGLGRGQPMGAISPVAPTASPYSYVAPQGGTVFISGGTVSLVQVSRDGVTNFSTGQTAGAFPVSLGDTLIIHYSGLPTVAFIPR